MKDYQQFYPGLRVYRSKKKAVKFANRRKKITPSGVKVYQTLGKRYGVTY